MSEKKSKGLWYALAGAAAGVVNGFFGGGGGQVLVAMLAGKCGLDQRKAFATSVAVIAPLCALSAAIYWFRGQLDLLLALPYLAGGPWAALSYWVAGIPFDLLHCAGNFVMALVLFQPCRKVLSRLMNAAPGRTR